jgi:hypothetical protein
MRYEVALHCLDIHGVLTIHLIVEEQKEVNEHAARLQDCSWW